MDEALQRPLCSYYLSGGTSLVNMGDGCFHSARATVKKPLTRPDRHEIKILPRIQEAWLGSSLCRPVVVRLAEGPEVTQIGPLELTRENRGGSVSSGNDWTHLGLEKGPSSSARLSTLYAKCREIQSWDPARKNNAGTADI